MGEPVPSRLPGGQGSPPESHLASPSPYEAVAGSYSSETGHEMADIPEYSGGPGPWRGVLVMLLTALTVWALAARVNTGVDDQVTRLGRIEVTARLVEKPEQFPNLGAYRYTYVVKYQVIEVHRSDPQGKYPLAPGAEIFVGHYKPWLPRSQIKDNDWGEQPLGGKLDRLVAGEVHRLALDYELADLAPSGALDYCFPPNTNRFFARWTNPTSY